MLGVDAFNSWMPCDQIVGLQQAKGYSYGCSLLVNIHLLIGLFLMCVIDVSVDIRLRNGGGGHTLRCFALWLTFKNATRDDFGDGQTLNTSREANLRAQLAKPWNWTCFRLQKLSRRAPILLPQLPAKNCINSLKQRALHKRMRQFSGSCCWTCSTIPGSWMQALSVRIHIWCLPVWQCSFRGHQFVLVFHPYLLDHEHLYWREPLVRFIGKAIDDISKHQTPIVLLMEADWSLRSYSHFWTLVFSAVTMLWGWWIYPCFDWLIMVNILVISQKIVN